MHMCVYTIVLLELFDISFVTQLRRAENLITYFMFYYKILDRFIVILNLNKILFVIRLRKPRQLKKGSFFVWSGFVLCLSRWRRSAAILKYGKNSKSKVAFKAQWIELCVPKLESHIKKLETRSEELDRTVKTFLNKNI